MLFTLVAPAGAGKNTLMKYVLARTNLRQIPTATTRPIRHYELHGREHLFVSEAEFRRMLDNGELLEYEVIHGNLYGMPRASVEAALDAGQAIIVDIGMMGDASAREAYPENIISVFVQPPSIGSLIARMHDRGEQDANISRRLLRVPDELAYARACDYLILNDSLADAGNKLYEIVEARLLGNTNVRGDAQIEYHFSFVAQMTPIFDNLALRHDSRPFEPEAPFASGEMPHEVAFRALRRELDIDFSPDAVIGGDKPDGTFLPPVKLSHTQDASGERITYAYCYRLDQRIDVPDGWSWAELPEPLSAALLERRSEV
ncbi:MAG: hypothetical protein U0521_17575 [Anaerolineae bacterium]